MCGGLRLGNSHVESNAVKRGPWCAGIVKRRGPAELKPALGQHFSFLGGYCSVSIIAKKTRISLALVTASGREHLTWVVTGVKDPFAV